MWKQWHRNTMTLTFLTVTLKSMTSLKPMAVLRLKNTIEKKREEKVETGGEEKNPAKMKHCHLEKIFRAIVTQKKGLQRFVSSTGNMEFPKFYSIFSHL